MIKEKLLFLDIITMVKTKRSGYSYEMAFDVLIGIGIFVYFAYSIKTIFVDRKPTPEFIKLHTNDMFMFGIVLLAVILCLHRNKSGYFPAFLLIFTFVLSYLFVHNLKFQNWVEEKFHACPPGIQYDNVNDTPVGKAFATSDGDGVKGKSYRKLRHVTELINNPAALEVPYEGNAKPFIPSQLDLLQAAGKAYPFKPNVNLRFIA